MKGRNSHELRKLTWLEMCVLQKSADKQREYRIGIPFWPKPKNCFEVLCFSLSHHFIPLLLCPQAPPHNYLLIEAVSVSSSDQNQLEPQNVSGGGRIQYPLK